MTGLARFFKRGESEPAAEPSVVAPPPFIVVRLGTTHVPPNHGVAFDCAVPYPPAVAEQPGAASALVVVDVRIFSRLITPRATVDVVKSGVSLLIKPVTPLLGRLFRAPIAHETKPRLFAPGELLELVCSTNESGSLIDLSVHVTLLPHVVGAPVWFDSLSPLQPKQPAPPDGGAS